MGSPQAMESTQVMRSAQAMESAQATGRARGPLSKVGATHEVHTSYGGGEASHAVFARVSERKPWSRRKLRSPRKS